MLLGRAAREFLHPGHRRLRLMFVLMHEGTGNPQWGKAIRSSSGIDPCHGVRRPTGRVARQRSATASGE